MRNFIDVIGTFNYLGPMTAISLCMPWQRGRVFIFFCHLIKLVIFQRRVTSLLITSQRRINALFHCCHGNVKLPQCDDRHLALQAVATRKSFQFFCPLIKLVKFHCRVMLLLITSQKRINALFHCCHGNVKLPRCDDRHLALHAVATRKSLQFF